MAKNKQKKEKVSKNKQKVSRAKCLLRRPDKKILRHDAGLMILQVETVKKSIEVDYVW